MALDFEIRRYREEDREQCRALWKELTDWHHEIYRDPTIGRKHPEEHFDKHLAMVGLKQLWLAVHGSKIVGLIGLIIRGNEAEIEPLIVRKGYRGKGIGTRLVETIVSEAHEMGVRFLNIKPVARNIRAIKFLYDQGFRNLGHIELFIDFSDHRWKPGPRIFGNKFNI